MHISSADIDDYWYSQGTRAAMGLAHSVTTSVYNLEKFEEGRADATKSLLERISVVEDTPAEQTYGWHSDSTFVDSGVQAAQQTPTLSQDSQERKDTPIYSGVMAYFPLALAAVARVSKAGNDKHNPGQPLHWSRGKSTDHKDCIARHLIEADGVDPSTGELHAAALAWRALANLQLAEEKRLAEKEAKK